LTLLLVTILSSCVVTDEIQFEDYENIPLSIKDYEPSTNIFSVTKKDLKTFSITIVDPDIDENTIDDLQARIIFESDLIDRNPNNCYDKESVEIDGTIAYKITCTINLGAGYSIPDNSLLEVKMEVSDRGFDSPDDAYLVFVNWVLMIELTDEGEWLK